MMKRRRLLRSKRPRVDALESRSLLSLPGASLWQAIPPLPWTRPLLPHAVDLSASAPVEILPRSIPSIESAARLDEGGMPAPAVIVVSTWGSGAASGLSPLSLGSNFGSVEAPQSGPIAEIAWPRSAPDHSDPHMGSASDSWIPHFDPFFHGPGENGPGSGDPNGEDMGGMNADTQAPPSGGPMGTATPSPSFSPDDVLSVARAAAEWQSLAPSQLDAGSTGGSSPTSGARSTPISSTGVSGVAGPHVVTTVPYPGGPMAARLGANSGSGAAESRGDDPVTAGVSTPPSVLTTAPPRARRTSRGGRFSGRRSRRPWRHGR